MNFYFTLQLQMKFLVLKPISIIKGSAAVPTKSYIESLNNCKTPKQNLQSNFFNSIDYLKARYIEKQLGVSFACTTELSFQDKNLLHD
jgi:hypothetical protein